MTYSSINLSIVNSLLNDMTRVFAKKLLHQWDLAHVAQDESDVPVDITKYQGMIDSLLYLTTIHPNIMFSL